MRDIVYEELQRLFRSYKHKVRRIDQFRPKANVRGRPKLRKADYTTGTDLWDVFADRMQERLLNALTVGAISIHSIMAARWPDKVLEIDSEAIARQLQSGIGTMVTRVSKTIKRQVGRQIVGWYNTPGASMQTIVKQLMPTFDLTRAELIARTEITRLDSLVTEQIAQKIEATEWWWMTLRDQLVCTRNLTGPDGKTYAGCRALHGKTFKVGQPMPPDGSHIGCRCKAILIAPVSGTSRSTEPIIDLSHLTKAEWNEEDHPRAEDGRFGDKAGGSSSVPKGQHQGVTADGLTMPEAFKVNAWPRDAERGKNNYRLGNAMCKTLSLEVEKEIGADIDLKAMRHAGEGNRKSLKIDVAGTLAKKTGVEFSMVATVIKTWATSSNESYNAMLMQKAIADKYGMEMNNFQKERIKVYTDWEEALKEAEKQDVKDKTKALFRSKITDYAKSVYSGALEYKKKHPISEWWQCVYEAAKNVEPVTNSKFIDSYSPGDAYSVGKDDFTYETIASIGHNEGKSPEEAVAETLNDINTAIDDYTYEPSHRLRNQFDAGMLDKVIEAMYTNTQDTFKQLGFSPDDEIEIYRGIGGTRGTYLAGETVEVHGNPAESWSLSPGVADGFGKVILMSKVKVRNILSTAMSGFGCMNEIEIVTLNGTKSTALVVQSNQKRSAK